ncbi:hypothetical protein LIER_42940 [Lithospermum erythrorhizon]|uniref:DUF2007 domain-containing protein n=1 Tax=Lithospermum erythrorhizon TaxID=34254 RepID=A0AAV3P788_LITER
MARFVLANDDAWCWFMAALDVRKAEISGQVMGFPEETRCIEEAGDAGTVVVVRVETEAEVEKMLNLKALIED